MGGWSLADLSFFLSNFGALLLSEFAARVSLIFISDMLGCTRIKLGRGRTWANFVFLSNVLASCYDRSSLYEFLCLFFFFFFDILARTRGWSLVQLRYGE